MAPDRPRLYVVGGETDPSEEERKQREATLSEAFSIVAASPDRRVQRTLRRFRSTLEKGGHGSVPADQRTQALSVELGLAIRVNYTDTISRNVLRGSQYVDRGGNLSREGQEEMELDDEFKLGLRDAVNLLVQDQESVEVFFGNFNVKGTSTAVSERLAIALTKYVDQRYFPQHSRRTLSQPPAPANNI